MGNASVHPSYVDLFGEVKPDAPPQQTATSTTCHHMVVGACGKEIY
jgi:hypothetical protein